MSLEISDICMYLPAAKVIWDSIKKSYSKVKDDAQIYELKIKITFTRQGSKTVIKYVNILKGLWQEMDHYCVIQMKCNEDTATLKVFIEKDWTYDFLAGLNMEFDQTFSNVIPSWLRGTKLFRRSSKRLVDHLGLSLTKEDLQSVVDLMEPYGQISNGIELLSPPIDWTRQAKFPHAVWAAGRGLMAILLPNYDVVDNIWLEPAAWEGIGCTKITKARSEGSLNGNLESRSYLEKKLVFSFGSCIAGQMLLPFGEENYLSSSEIKLAQEIATRMVLQYGWGPDDSPVIYVTSNALGTLSMGNKHELEMAAKVEEMYNLAYEKAKEMLQKNRQVLEVIVEQLLEYENLTGEDLICIFEENHGIREQEPFTILKHQPKEVGRGIPLDSSGNAAAVALLGIST